jgi:hypothetical protein
MLPDDVVDFIRSHLGSVWALQLMLTLMAEPARAWTLEALVRDMRANDLLVSSLLDRFQRDGFVVKHDGLWRWQPATKKIEELSRQVAAAHATTPFAVIQIIATAPARSLAHFADAFRLRKD